MGGGCLGGALGTGGGGCLTGNGAGPRSLDILRSMAFLALFGVEVFLMEETKLSYPLMMNADYGKISLFIFSARIKRFSNQIPQYI